jgi:hypothetical protein
MTSNSVAESAACKGTSSGGFSKLNEYLRSVLMSPTSLALFAIANSQTEDVQDLFQQPLPALTDMYSELLTGAMDAADCAANLLPASSSSPSPPKKARRAGEPHITAQLKNKLSELFQLAATGGELKALTEWHIQDPDTDKKTAKMKMDLVVYTNGTDETDGNGYIDTADPFRRRYDAYAFMEFGVCIQEDDGSLVKSWWEKTDQLLKYMNAICVEKYRGAARGKSKLGGNPGVPFPKYPVILCVLVWSKSRKRGAIGTFVLEWCGISKKIRMALLSAELCPDMKATSAAFGKVVSLIHALADLRKESQLANAVWTYLGPDCVKVGTAKVS